MSKTKVLWHSNAPHSPTGYGQQTALFAPGIAEHYDMAISSFYGLEGAPILWEGIPVLPGMGGQFGDEWLVRHASHFFGGNPRDGTVVTLMDVWVLDAKWMSQLNAACWVPIDHDPAPPRVVEFFVQSGAIPIAMSRFGERMLGRLDPLYVPHGVDTEKYRPHDQRAVRKLVGVPQDVFLVGMVAANKGRPSRKGFAQAFQAFAKFAETHDDAYLYLHTMMNPALAGGEDLAALLEAVGVPQERVMIADQYRVLFDPYSAETMSKIYSTMDVLLNPAMGEGFGVPVLEAQACGVPTIVTDFSAMSEVSSGWKVGHSTRYWSGLSAWQAIPDIDDINDALEECHGLTSRERETMSNAARTHAMGYALPKVLNQYMLPALQTVERRFANQQPVTIAPRRNPMPTEPPPDFAISEKRDAA